MKISYLFLLGGVSAGLLALNSWNIKRLTNKAYNDGYTYATATWKQALLKTENEAAKKHQQAQKQALAAEIEGQNIQHNLENELLALEKKNAELENQGKFNCGFDAAHIRLLNSQTTSH